jgi:lipoprotein LprG
MQTRPRLAVLISLFAALATALILTSGCSSGSGSNAPLPDAATLLKESSATTKGQQSVHLVITTTGDIKELPIQQLTGDLTNTPAVAASGKVDITALGTKLEGVGFVVADGTLYGALTPNDWTNFGPAADIYDVSAILNPDKGLANVLANFTDPKAVDHENVGGVDTVKVTGSVSADAVNAIAPQLKVTGPIPGTAWISPDGDHKLIQAKLEPTSSTNIQLTMSDWGKPVTVTKPAV